MKKIISVLLAIACVFALASCGSSNIETIVENSEPSSIKTITTLVTAEEVFRGTYFTEKTDSGFKFDYEYECYADVSDASKNHIKTEKGTVYYSNGQYSEDGKSWSAVKPEVDYQSYTLNLSKDNFKEYTLNETETSLVASFAPENSELVLGKAISATGDITITVSSNGVYLTAVSILYTSELGEVKIDTSYAYSASVSNAGEDVAE